LGVKIGNFLFEGCNFASIRGGCNIGGRGGGGASIGSGSSSSEGLSCGSSFISGLGKLVSLLLDAWLLLLDNRLLRVIILSKDLIHDVRGCLLLLLGSLLLRHKARRRVALDKFLESGRVLGKHL